MESGTWCTMDDQLTNKKMLAEELRLTEQSAQMSDQALLLADEAERFRVGPRANGERYRRALAAYRCLHEQHMQVFATFVRIHDEILRRGLR